jgi:hypothetical protein
MPHLIPLDDQLGVDEVGVEHFAPVDVEEGFWVQPARRVP